MWCSINVPLVTISCQLNNRRIAVLCGRTVHAHYVCAVIMCGSLVSLLCDVIWDDCASDIWGNLPSFIICGTFKRKHQIALAGEFAFQEVMDLSQDGLQNNDDHDDDDNDHSPDIRLLDCEFGDTLVL